MIPRIPTADGQINCYNLGNAEAMTPRIYFVNGIQVLPRQHALMAGYLSLLVERPVWGVHNATAGVDTGGFARDIWQCARDYSQNASARFSSDRDETKPPTVSEAEIPSFLRDLEKNYTIWNRATVELFKDLVRHRFQNKMIVAHSQGNLITSNALFVLEDVLGSAALAQVRVFSLASPSPGWPIGLRYTKGGGGRQDNAFMNDMVALLRPHNAAKKIGFGGWQNDGDFRTLPGAGPIGLAPHDSYKIIDTLNFLKSIRGELGLSKEFTNDFLRDCSEKAAAAFPEEVAR